VEFKPWCGRCGADGGDGTDQATTIAKRRHEEHNVVASDLAPIRPADT